jgi:hypothetical protein
VGADWLLIEAGMGRDCLVAWDAVVAVGGLTTATAAAAAGPDRRLTLRRALAGLGRARDRFDSSAIKGSGEIPSSTGASMLAVVFPSRRRSRGRVFVRRCVR